MDLKSKFLSEKERQRGQKYYNRYQALNGAGYNFLGDTVVALLAMTFGASNIQLGYLSAAPFVAGMILPFLPRLLAGKNYIKIHYGAWLIRGLICLFYFSLFFLSGKAAVYLILTVYTCFCIFRMAGVVVANPELKLISTPATYGRVISQTRIAFQVTALLSKLISFAISSVQAFSGLTGLLAMQFGGVVMNTAASSQLKKIPCRDGVSYTKGRNLNVLLKEALQDRNECLILLLGWTNVSLMVLMGLTIPFLRLEAKLPFNIIFLYSMTQVLAYYLSGVFTRTFGDRIGSRPLLLVSMSGGIAVSLFWMIVPVAAPLIVFLLLGFFSYFCLGASDIFINRLFLYRIPEKEAFSYNAMNNFMMAIVSLLFGVIGGFCIDIGTLIHFPVVLNPYAILFALIFILGVIGLWLSLSVEEKGSLSARDMLSVFSPDGMRAYIDIGKLGRADSEFKKKTVLLSIGNNANETATREIKSLMGTPLSNSKEEMIISLFNFPRPSLLPYLLSEAADPDSYYREKALFALGAYKGSEIEHLLISLLDDPDLIIRSIAAKSLGRTGNTDYLDKVRIYFLQDNPIAAQLNYIIALKNMDTEGTFLQYLFQSVHKRRSRRYKETVFSLYSDILDFQPYLEELYRAAASEGNDPVIDTFLNDCRDSLDFFRARKNLKQFFGHKSWVQIGSVCETFLRKQDFNGSEQFLKKGILTLISTGGPTDFTDALACVYFTYQLIRP